MRMRSRDLRPTLVVCVGVFISVPIFSEANLRDVDRTLFSAVREDARNGVFDQAMPVVTEIGSGRIAIPIAILGAVITRGETRTTSLVLGISLATSGLTTATLKGRIGRSRPEGPDDRRSMPSGHTTTAFALAAVLSNRYPQRRAILYGLATAVALSRVYLGRHYPSDVVAGALVGTGVTRLVLSQETKFLSVRF